MATTSQQYQRTGSFIQTTQVWDQSQIQEVNVNSQEFKNLLVRLYQNVNQIAIILNTKTTGAYYEQEFVTGDLYFPNPNNLTNNPPVVPNERQVSRKVINFGALPSAGVPIKSVAHNLDVGAQWTFTRIYGCANNPSLFATPPNPPPQRNYIPLPYISVADPTGNLELSVDQEYVTIETAGTDYSAWTITYIVVEWITL